MWHKARAQPSKSGAGRPGVGAFSNSALTTCQGRSVHGHPLPKVGAALKFGRPATKAGRPA
jgi:hypothetical protein